jgi:uncharacterized protein (DUF1800 family)
MVTVQAVIAANRFGLGARPGDLAEIGQDHEDWLLTQLSAAVPSADNPGPGSGEIVREFRRLLRARNELRRGDDQQLADDARREFTDYFRSQYRTQAIRRYEIAAGTDTPFKERLVHFWSNHFAISADKQAVTPLVGAFEDEAIRPHVTGRFVDMLMAVEKHPGMILYLDNQASIGPFSLAGKLAAERGRSLGLNENLAREILELHTLGVDGGYSQEDVTTFAKILTGWTVGSGQGRAGGTEGEFLFRSNSHEPFAKTILGKRYPQGGVDEGEAVLEDLAAHPATATFLAEKLARHFVADDPPADLVEDLAAAYSASDGDLSAVYGALIAAPAAWAEPLAKYKTPEDYLVSTYRSFDQQPDNPERMLTFLELLGQRPYTPGSPAGWPDTMAHWDGGDALIKRIEWAAAAGRQISDRVRPEELGDAILGPVFGDHTRTAVSRAESSAQGLTLLLASPEFQRR